MAGSANFANEKHSDIFNNKKRFSKREIRHRPMTFVREWEDRVPLRDPHYVTKVSPRAEVILSPVRSVSPGGASNRSLSDIVSSSPTPVVFSGRTDDQYERRQHNESLQKGRDGTNVSRRYSQMGEQNTSLRRSYRQEPDTSLRHSHREGYNPSTSLSRQREEHVTSNSTSLSRQREEHVTSYREENSAGSSLRHSHGEESRDISIRHSLDDSRNYSIEADSRLVHRSQSMVEATEAEEKPVSPPGAQASMTKNRNSDSRLMNDDGGSTNGVPVSDTPCSEADSTKNNPAYSPSLSDRGGDSDNPSQEVYVETPNIASPQMMKKKGVHFTSKRSKATDSKEKPARSEKSTKPPRKRHASSPVEALRYYTGQDGTRSKRNIIDLDLALNCVIETLAEARQNSHSYGMKSLVKNIKLQFTEEIVQTIESVEVLRSYKQDITESKRNIKAMRTDLLNLQQRKAELQSRHQEDGPDPSKLESISQWMSDFRQLMHDKAVETTSVRKTRKIRA